MHLRRPGGPAETPSPSADERVSFRVPTGVPAAKVAVAAVVAVAALLTGEELAVIVGAVAAVALVVFAVRDMLARERLRADRAGIDVVHGFAGRRHLDWAEIEAIRVDERLRLGVRSRLLEVDADAEIYLFSRYDLGADPSNALTAINPLRPAS